MSLRDILKNAHEILMLVAMLFALVMKKDLAHAGATMNDKMDTIIMSVGGTIFICSFILLIVGLVLMAFRFDLGFIIASLSALLILISWAAANA